MRYNQPYDKALDLHEFADIVGFEVQQRGLPQRLAF
jgi:hypothetical protein